MRMSMLIALFAAGCSAPQQPGPHLAPTAPTAAVATPDPAVASPPSAPSPSPELADVERVVATDSVTYVFRVSQIANLVFQLDCLAGLHVCSRSAFSADWRAAEWTADDDAALTAWQQLRRYRGDIANGSPRADPPLPLPRPPRTVANSARIAAYGARDADDLLARLAPFASAADIAKTREILAHFTPRTADRWRVARAGLLAAQADFAALVDRPDVRALVEQIAALYGVGATRQTFELIARPRHRSESSAQQLGDLAVVEVTIGDPAQRKLPVVMHEMFHAWFAAAPIEQQIALVERFAASSDPLAVPGYGLLNEALSTALGNGLIARAVAPDEYDRRIRTSQGLYADRYVDETAKALLPALEARLAAGASVFDDDFIPEYVRAVHAAFPNGLAPIVYLRPMACAFDMSFVDAQRRLREVSRTSIAECTSGASQAVDLFRRRAAWGQAILWPRAKLAELVPLVDAPTMATLRRQALRGQPFVLTQHRSPSGVLFIFVADDAAAAHKLVEAFAAQTELRAGVVVF